MRPNLAEAMEKEKIEGFLRSLGHSADARAEALTGEDYARLTNKISEIFPINGTR